jgi:hypothetical protein
MKKSCIWSQSEKNRKQNQSDTQAAANDLNYQIFGQSINESSQLLH